MAISVTGLLKNLPSNSDITIIVFNKISSAAICIHFVMEVLYRVSYQEYITESLVFYL